MREEAACGLTFPGIFALMAQAYFERDRDHGATLARIAAKNHANGVRNPLAHMRRDLGFEFCNTISERNPVIAAPLAQDRLFARLRWRRRVGAHARAGSTQGRRAPIPFSLDRPRGTISCRCRAATPVAFEGPRLAWRAALERAGLVPA